jgi:integrase
MRVFQRGDNFYIDFCFKGVRIRESIGPNRKLAESVIAKRKTEIAENKYLDVKKELAPVNFHDFAVEYIAWSKVNKKPLTSREDIYKMRRLEKEFGGQNIQGITTWLIEKYKSKRREMLKTKGKGKGKVKVGPSTVNGELRLLKHIFSMAIEWGKCKENPARKVKVLKGETQRVRFLSPEETEIFLSNCVDHLKNIATVVLNTGMRKGEVLGLKWSDVNFHQGIITLTDTKNREIRNIPMNETVRGTLIKVPKNGDYVFSDGNERRFTSLQHSFERAREKSGIEDFHFHDLRHTFASNLVMGGVDIMTVKELLGHKTPAMTLRYSHLSPSHKALAVNILDRTQKTSQDEMLKKVVSISR